jgi:hypothetical protein
MTAIAMVAATAAPMSSLRTFVVAFLGLREVRPTRALFEDTSTTTCSANDLVNLGSLMVLSRSFPAALVRRPCDTMRSADRERWPASAVYDQ